MPEASKDHDVLVIGGGNAGISLAARLRRDGLHDVAVTESRPVHRYRPLLNYVGAGEASMSDLERPAANVLPDGCTSVRDEVVAVEAEGRVVVLASGTVTGFVGDGDTDDLVGHELLRKPFTVAALAAAVAGSLSRGASGSHPISGAAAAG